MTENQEQNPKFKNPKRDKTISIKVTNKELTKIYLYASEKPHTSISEYIRDKALKQAKRPVEITEEDYQKLERFITKSKDKSNDKQISVTDETKYVEEFLKIMNELSPKVAENGYVHYKDGGKEILELVKLAETLKK